MVWYKGRAFCDVFLIGEKTHDQSNRSQSRSSGCSGLFDVDCRLFANIVGITIRVAKIIIGTQSKCAGKHDDGV